MWNLENGTDEQVCRAEIETEIDKNVWTPRGDRDKWWGWECDELGDWD